MVRRKLMIARLAAAHRQGRLVPFLGAGMSVPACPGWADFIAGLERQVFGQAQSGRASGTDSDALIRRANTAVRQLRLRGDPPFARAVSRALEVEPPPGVPAQTRALAQLYWPLALTSNYDGLFVKAWNAAHAGTGSEMDVLGRSPADCRRVLTSLHASRPPILWALQGYTGDLGGGDARQLQRFRAIDEAARKLRPGSGTPSPTLDVPSAKSQEEWKRAMHTVQGLARARRLEFEQQLVVGHEEYRRVTHTEPQFRRAFAEVYRSRSLLFVGSSLSDQYLLNLFGEALEIFGSNPFPHYAFVLKGTTDPEFLRTRLNTFVHEYADHEELPRLLEELYRTVENTSARMRVWSYAVATSAGSQESGSAADIHVVRGELPLPGPDECIALGVSLDQTGKITFETAAENILERMGCRAQASTLPFSPADRVLQVPGQPLFLFVVTTEQGRQDLRQYARSIAAVLDRVAASEFRMIRTRLPLPDREPNDWLAWLGRWVTGGLGTFIQSTVRFFQQFFATDFRQRFWLMEIMRAYGRWRRTKGSEGRLQLSVHLTDPGILFDMSTGRIDPLELLMCDDLRFTVEIEHDSDTLMSESYQCEGTMTLRAIARQLRILGLSEAPSAPAQWLVEVEPSPTGVPHVLALSEAAALDTTLSELGVVTDSVLRFVRLTKPIVNARPGSVPQHAKSARTPSPKASPGRAKPRVGPRSPEGGRGRA
jgi:hypothetical protein